jgi:RNA polymerase sigma-70 factor (ECF subfamily)
MDDREIIKLYNCRSEDALLETEKKYGKLVSFIIGRLIKNQLDVEDKDKAAPITTEAFISNPNK